MSRTYIFQALKAHLKARGMTYKDLAQSLGLSEPTIKRMFTACDCSLERRIQHDIYYIDIWSFWLDVQLLLMTFVRWRNRSE